MKKESKIKEFIKKNWTKIKLFFKIIIGAIITIVIVKKVSEIGKVVYNKKYKEIPGQKNKVLVYNNVGKSEIIDLPINPETGKQVTVDEIEQVGLPEKINDKGVLNVKIKSKPINRRSFSD